MYVHICVHCRCTSSNHLCERLVHSGRPADRLLTSYWQLHSLPFLESQANSPHITSLWVFTHTHVFSHIRMFTQKHITAMYVCTWSMVVTTCTAPTLEHSAHNAQFAVHGGSVHTLTSNINQVHSASHHTGEHSLHCRSVEIHGGKDGPTCHHTPINIVYCNGLEVHLCQLNVDSAVCGILA